MQLADGKRFIQTQTRWLRPAQLSAVNRNILYLTLDTAVQGLMMGGIFSFLAVFLVRLGATTLQTSLLTSLPAIVMVISSLPSGAFIQKQRDLVRLTNIVRLFHRGSILLVALLPSFVHEHLIEVIIFLWTVKAITNAMLESSWMAVVAEVIPARRRASVNGMRWTVMGITTALAGALFGTMLDTIAFPLNYQIVFIISFLGGATGMVFWGKIRIPENVQVTRQKRRTKSIQAQLSAYWQSIRVPAFLRYELTISVLRLALNLPVALYSIYWIRELNTSDLWIGWRATASQLAMIVGYFLWGRVVQRRGHVIPLLVCTLGVGFTPVLTAFIPGQTWLPAIAIIQGLFITGMNLSTFDILFAVCPDDRRPTFFAVNTMLASLMIFLAPMLGSALADRIGIRGVFFITGGIHVVAMVLFWRFRVAEAAEAEGNLES
ncbi:MAG: MFS transporter [Anaerolineae bacterium]|nr:MFS transporter [Anaerolineae bacterium]